MAAQYFTSNGINGGLMDATDFDYTITGMKMSGCDDSFSHIVVFIAMCTFAGASGTVNSVTWNPGINSRELTHYATSGNIQIWAGDVNNFDADLVINAGPNGALDMTLAALAVGTDGSDGIESSEFISGTASSVSDSITTCGRDEHCFPFILISDALP